MTDLLFVLLGLLALLLGAFGMAHRAKTRPENVHRHEARRRILDTLAQSPGATLQELVDHLGLARGTARYHLRILEGAGAISSLTTGSDHHFFPRDAAPNDRAALGILHRARTLDIVLAILRQPGIVQKRLLKQIGMHRKVFRAYIRLLVEERLLREERARTMRMYFPTQRLETLLARCGVDARTAAPPGPRPSLGDRPPGTWIP